MRVQICLAVTLTLGVGMETLEGQSLRGSSSSMAEQLRKSIEADYDRLRNPFEVGMYLRMGLLVRVAGNRDYRLSGVSYPYARAEVKLFVERLSAQYRAACGEQLVVTSLTRPLSSQPRNASTRSVHPAGMSVDVRISQKASCRRFLEVNTLVLEGMGLVQVTRERRPPHYHIAVYPEYRGYVAMKMAPATKIYVVKKGDSLWSIARLFGIPLESLLRINSLSRDKKIIPGQKLKVPKK